MCSIPANNFGQPFICQLDKVVPSCIKLEFNGNGDAHPYFILNKLIKYHNTVWHSL